MAEKEIELTDEEKKSFAETVTGFAGNMIRFNQKTIRSNIISGVITTPIAFGIVWGLGFNPLFFAPFLLVGTVGVSVLTHIVAVKSINKILKNASNGKIKYGRYKKLVKSGELEKWLKLDVKETEQTDQQVKNNNSEKNGEGLTLSAEEVKLLQKLMGKKGLENLIENQPNIDTEINKQSKNAHEKGRNV